MAEPQYASDEHHRRSSDVDEHRRLLSAALQHKDTTTSDVLFPSSGKATCFPLILALLLASVLGLAVVSYRYYENCPASVNPDAPPLQMYYHIPLHHQQTNYTDGPSAALSLMAAYGVAANESELAAEMGVGNSNGARWRDIAAVMVMKGFTVQAAERLDANFIRATTARGHLTIVGFEAWSTDRLNFHYSVIVGYNATGVIIMDPRQAPGYYGYVDFDSFISRWRYVTAGSQWNALGLTAWMPGKALLPAEQPPTNVLPTFA